MLLKYLLLTSPMEGDKYEYPEGEGDDAEQVGGAKEREGGKVKPWFR